MSDYKPPENLTKEQRFALEFTKIQEDAKTTRWVGAGCMITLFSTVLIVCVAFVMVKWMDDPPWLKVVAFVLGPNGLAWLIIIRMVAKQKKRTEHLQQSLENQNQSPAKNGKV